MADDRQMTQAELEAVLPEAQIGALQAYAIFMEELVGAMLVARLSDSRAAALAAQAEKDPAAGAAVQAALEDAQARNLHVAELFGRGAKMRLACAKIGALPLKQPIMDVPDALAANQPPAAN